MPPPAPTERRAEARKRVNLDARDGAVKNFVLSLAPDWGGSVLELAGKPISNELEQAIETGRLHLTRQTMTRLLKITDSEALEAELNSLLESQI